MVAEYFQPYTRTTSNDVSPYIVIVNTKRLADTLAVELEDVRRIQGVEPFLTITGVYKDSPITIGFPGYGAYSLAIMLEEYIRLGAKIVIRLGSSLALTPTLNIGGLILACSAVRNDGVSRNYVSIEYPACANYYLLKFLEDMLKARGMSFQVGTVLSLESYHVEENEEIKKWRRLNVLAVDTDTSALYIIAGLRRIKAASLLVIEGNIAKGIGRGEIYVNEEKADLARRVEDRLIEAGKTLLDSLRLLRERTRLEAELVSREAE